jgi:hypothetical protein
VTAAIPVDCPFCGIERITGGSRVSAIFLWPTRTILSVQFRSFVRSISGFQEVGVRGIVCCKGGPVLCLCQVLIGLKILYRVLSLI